LNDQERRLHLEKLKVEDAMTDAVFIEAKRSATDFQKGLSELFFATDEKLTRAAQHYGVF